MALRSLNKLLVGLSMFVCASAFATPFTVNLSNIDSYGAFGDEGNTVITLNVGANATIIGMSYNVNVTAYSPSYLSELGLAFTNNAVTDGVLLTPGFADEGPGTGTYADTLDLILEGLSFSVDADGILRLEFYEDYSDELFPDGIWNFGTLTFITDGIDVPPPSGDVPEPASGLLIGAGLALMGYTARRRRGASKAV
jgi:hypothetical protein